MLIIMGFTPTYNPRIVLEISGPLVSSEDKNTTIRHNVVLEDLNVGVNYKHEYTNAFDAIKNNAIGGLAAKANKAIEGIATLQRVLDGQRDNSKDGPAGKFKSKYTQFKLWTGTSGLNLPSLKFKFFFGMNGKYDAFNEVVNPILNLAKQFTPRPMKEDGNRFVGPVPSEEEFLIRFGLVLVNDLRGGSPASRVTKNDGYIDDNGVATDKLKEKMQELADEKNNKAGSALPVNVSYESDWGKLISPTYDILKTAMAAGGATSTQTEIRRGMSLEEFMEAKAIRGTPAALYEASQVNYRGERIIKIPGHYEASDTFINSFFNTQSEDGESRGGTGGALLDFFAGKKQVTVTRDSNGKIVKEIKDGSGNEVSIVYTGYKLTGQKYSNVISNYADEFAERCLPQENEQEKEIPADPGEIEKLGNKLYSMFDQAAKAASAFSTVLRIIINEKFVTPWFLPETISWNFNYDKVDANGYPCEGSLSFDGLTTNEMFTTTLFSNGELTPSAYDEFIAAEEEKAKNGGVDLSGNSTSSMGSLMGQGR